MKSTNLLFLLFAAFMMSGSLLAADDGLLPGGLASHREVWTAYLDNREKIDAEIAADESSKDSLGKATRIAVAAIYLESPDYETHIKRAVRLVGKLKEGNANLERSSTISQLLMPLLDAGAIDVALEVHEELSKPVAAPSIPKFAFPKIKGAPDYSKIIGITTSIESNQSKIFLARLIGDYEEEEQALSEAISIMKEAESLPGTSSGGAKRVVQMHLIRMALSQALQGKVAQADETLDRAMALFSGSEDSGLPGELAQAVRFLDQIIAAEACLLIGRTKDAERFVATGLKMTNLESVQDTKLFWKIFALAGKVSFENGDSTKAIPYWKKALSESRKPNPRTGFTLPESHPDSVFIKQGLAWSLLQAGDPSAGAEAIAIRDSQIAFVERLFRFASEHQRLAFLQSADPFSLLAETGQTEALADAVLQLKGSVLDSILEDRQIGRKTESPELSALVRELRIAKRLAFDSAWTEDAEAGEVAEEVERLEAQLGSLTRKSSTGSGALSVSTDDIAKALQAEDHLCEFIRYQRVAEEGGTVPWYGVVVFSSTGAPLWLPLAEAGPIDDAILLLKQSMSQAIDLNEEDLHGLLSSLYSSLLKPVESAVPPGHRLILSPDGGLSCLSFAVLLDGIDQFAAARWMISYVSTGRDLLENGEIPGKVLSLVVFADPEFSAAPTGAANVGPLRSISVPFDFNLPQLPSLPGTRKELQEIEAISVESGWKLEAHSGTDAKESIFTTWEKAPDILHFATHGLFLERQGSVSAAANATLDGLNVSSRVDNPLMRSLLTLTGAQSTFDLWGKQSRPNPAEDGILTAEEISLLDLDGTWLATLSACDTASGETLEGEGVLGLRRGFFLAGVDHLLMTFWPISDEGTVSLISDFYRALLETRHPGLALSKVQSNALVRIRGESGLKNAVMIAGPFAASVSGRMPDR